MRSSRTSFRKRPSSSRSSVVRTPGLPLPRSARARSTQFRSDDSVRSRSRAAAPTDLPSSRTSRTAPALNSSVKLRRARFGFRSAMVDIVSTFRKMSTKPDQAQKPHRSAGASDETDGGTDVTTPKVSRTLSEIRKTVPATRSIGTKSQSSP